MPNHCKNVLLSFFKIRRRTSQYPQEFKTLYMVDVFFYSTFIYLFIYSIFTTLDETIHTTYYILRTKRKQNTAVRKD